MSAVFSIWYIVALLLAAGVVACLVAFFKMDKQDKVLIEKFIAEQSAQEEVAKEEVAQVKEESKVE